jgi:hypothetical protein
MRQYGALLATLSILWPAQVPAQVQPSPFIRVAMGEDVAVRISRTGEAVPGARGPGALSNAEAVSLGRLWAQDGRYTGARYGVSADKGEIPVPTPVTAEEVHFTLVQFPEGQSALVVKNGYDRALIYRARIHRGKRRTSATVCLVIPRKRGIEHWPYRIDAVEISEMRLEPWQRGNPILCK